ncbi:MAG: hypothetical protein K0U52_06785 [Gammaproteobacteria bacterium]|nr:hypothetical protein [Gammaproteobacteria bacterium]
MSSIDSVLDVVQPVLLAFVIIGLFLWAINTNPFMLFIVILLVAFSLPSTSINTDQFQFYQQCSKHSTVSSCRLTSTGTCSNLYDTFQNDPEWAAYKERLCNPTLHSASLNRLSNSYDPANCTFGKCDPDCINTLQSIQLEMFAYACPPNSLGVGVYPINEPGEVLSISPLYGMGFRIMGWIGLVLILIVAALRFGTNAAVVRS